MLTKKLYEQATGRSQKSNIIAYQIRQSFRPGEITAEEANRIGYELASRFLKGKHAFIVATHTDREHIHNHIIYNSTTLDGTIMRCDSDSGKKLIKSMVLRTADRQGMC